jgi:hypothetical protein
MLPEIIVACLYVFKVNNKQIIPVCWTVGGLSSNGTEIYAKPGKGGLQKLGKTGRNIYYIIRRQSRHKPDR